MKTKFKLSLGALFLLNLLSVNAQTGIATVVATSNATAIGEQNGAIFPYTGGERSTFVGFQAGQNNTNRQKGSDNTFVGNESGSATTMGSRNSFFGSLSGLNNTAGSDNVAIGWGSGVNNNTDYNTFVGRSSGGFNTTGGSNTFIGALSGLNNLVGGCNVFLGFSAGSANVGGGNNVVTGFAAGSTFNAWSNSIYGAYAGQNSSGDGNVLIGYAAGRKSLGNNVMIGSYAGENAIVSNKLFIDNSNTATPLIWGDFALDQLKLNGKVGIGAVTAFPYTAGTIDVSNYKLFVTGGILTDEVRVNLSSSGTWADYVFNKDYNLKTLSEVEKFINENGHLPNVPSAKQVKEEGIELGNMSKIQQEKIEELTLYLIQQNKEIEELKAQVRALIQKSK